MSPKQALVQDQVFVRPTRFRLDSMKLDIGLRTISMTIIMIKPAYKECVDHTLISSRSRVCETHFMLGSMY